VFEKFKKVLVTCFSYWKNHITEGTCTEILRM